MANKKPPRLSPKARREVVRSLNTAISDYNHEAHMYGRFTIPTPPPTSHLVRISRMIANLNGVAWPE